MRQRIPLQVDFIMMHQGGCPGPVHMRHLGFKQDRFPVVLHQVPPRGLTPRGLEGLRKLQIHSHSLTTCLSSPSSRGKSSAPSPHNPAPRGSKAEPRKASPLIRGLHLNNISEKQMKKRLTTSHNWALAIYLDYIAQDIMLKEYSCGSSVKPGYPVQ